MTTYCRQKDYTAAAAEAAAAASAVTLDILQKAPRMFYTTGMSSGHNLAVKK